MLKARQGIPMTEVELAEWKQAFVDIEESIEEMEARELAENPNAKYLRLKQQELAF